MSLEPTGYAAVAVGPSRDRAIAAFGQLFDDLFLTTFDDLGAEVDLTRTGVLGIADGEGAPVLLERCLGSGSVPELVVEVPAEADRRRALADLLAQRPEVGVVSTRRAAGVGSVVAIGPTSPASISGPAVATLLDALGDAVSPQEPSWPEPAATVPVAGRPDRVPARARRPELPQPAASHGLAARLGRRGLAVAAAAALAGALGVLVLVLIGTSDLGADGVLVTTTLGIALVQVVTLAGLAYVVRNLRRARAETLEFRGQVLRRTDRLLKQAAVARRRSTSQGRRLTRVVKAGQREQKHHEYVVQLGRDLNRLLLHTRDDGRRLHLATQRQTQAMLNLRDLVRTEAAVPPAGGWAASPDLLLFCVDTLLVERPALVVECGSGLSTLFLALAAEQHRLPTRVVALEHDKQFAASTRTLLARHGVADRAEVRVAPLQQSSVPGHDTPWYAESALDGLDDIGMLVVDGPPTATGPQARYPAVPLLRDRLAARCTIVMDDLVRESDHETARRWAELLPDFDYSAVREFEKHLGLLRRG